MGATWLGLLGEHYLGSSHTLHSWEPAIKTIYCHHAGPYRAGARLNAALSRRIDLVGACIVPRASPHIQAGNGLAGEDKQANR